MASISDTPRPAYVYDSVSGTWVPVGIGAHSHSPAEIGAVSSSVVTTKGDLIAGTGAGTVTRRAVGTDGTILIADSTQSTGMNWAGYNVAGKNAIINGGFDIWQRGTSVAQTGSAIYTADRWCALRASGTTGSTFSRQATNDTTNLPNIQYCARAQRDSGNATTYRIYFANSFETVNSIPFVGKTVTYSFYARAGANFSSSGNGLAAQVLYGTGTDQNNLVAYTGEAVVISTTVTLTTTWQRFTFTGTVPTNATELCVRFYYDPVGTAGANDYFEVTGVQLELGSVATPFSRAGGDIQGELAKCQRYYWRNTVPTATKTATGIVGRSTTVADAIIQFPVTMRTNPSAVEYGGGTLVLTEPGVNAYNITSIAFVHASYQTAFIQPTTASGLSVGKVYSLDVPTNGYIGFSAEL